MGPGAGLRRRALLAAAGAGAAGAAGGWTALAGARAASPYAEGRGAGRSLPAGLPGGWVGASVARGHRLREAFGAKSGRLPPPALQRRVRVLVVGAGVSGLAAARALARRGIDDVQLLELEDEAGGNSRGHEMAGMRCPLGAHYLPLPGPQAHEVSALLEALGLARSEHGRTVYDERHLCHSPQERLFVDGGWVEGLLPPAAPGSTTLAQYRAFSRAVAEAQRDAPFTVPTARAAWTPLHAALDATTFARWLDARGLDDARLRWLLDYCCRDDYGAGADRVSAWAGLHYFASRHGFHAPGEDAAASRPDEPPDAVLTWPEGNAWLAQRMVAPLRDRLHTGRTVLGVREMRHEVELLAWDEHTARLEAWRASQVVLALPLFVAARLVDPAPPALHEAAAALRYAPWLVANLHLGVPLLDRLVGAAPAWDNVIYGSRALGYVDAMHQSTRPHPGPTVLTAYRALVEAERPRLLDDDWRPWAQLVLDEFAPVHPDLPAKLERIDLMRYGHAMSIPVPGVRSSAALAALAGARGRLRYAHADLSGYSVFEEAMQRGEAAVEGIG